MRAHEREGRPQQEFWIRFVAGKPDTDLKRRVPEIFWYCHLLADMISRKAAEEERDALPGRLARLAGAPESAFRAMAGIAGKAVFGLTGSA